MENGLSKKAYGCHFCESTFSSSSSRAHHHAKKHPREHKVLKGHKMKPNHICKYCHIGFGTRQSKWNHEQRCLSNPNLIKELKLMKKQNEKLIREELDMFLIDGDQKS